MHCAGVKLVLSPLAARTFYPTFTRHSSTDIMSVRCRFMDTVFVAGRTEMPFLYSPVPFFTSSSSHMHTSLVRDDWRASEDVPNVCNNFENK